MAGSALCWLLVFGYDTMTRSKTAGGILPADMYFGRGAFYGIIIHCCALSGWGL